MGNESQESPEPLSIARGPNNSQNFEKMPCNSTGTSRERPYMMIANMVSMAIEPFLSVRDLVQTICEILHEFSVPPRYRCYRIYVCVE